MSSTIIGLGTALPDAIVSQEDALVLAKDLCCQTPRQMRVLEEVYLKSGVQKRSTVLQAQLDQHPEANFFQPLSTACDTGPSTAERMAIYETKAGPLATRACMEALNDARLNAKEITHLVTVSCTGFFAPGFDIQLVKTLPLTPDVQRTHIGFMGCHGALNALRAANGYCSESENNIVLICATEICSMHFQYGWSKDLVVSNALFADGSAALVLTGNRTMANRDNRAPCMYADAASYVIPNTENIMSWKIGNNGFVMSLDKTVAEIIETNLPGFMETWLRKNNLSIDQISGWAVHPGGPRILDAVANALNLPADSLEASRQILSECGNMSSPTVLFILKNLLRSGRKLPYVVLGFGPGLTIEAALIA